MTTFQVEVNSNLLLVNITKEVSQITINSRLQKINDTYTTKPHIYKIYTDERHDWISFFNLFIYC